MQFRYFHLFHIYLENSNFKNATNDYILSNNFLANYDFRHKSIKVMFTIIVSFDKAYLKKISNDAHHLYFLALFILI